MNSKIFLEETASGFEQLIDQVINLVDGVNSQTINIPELEGKWSMLQCIKHMSIATSLYAKNVEAKFQTSTNAHASSEFRGSWKGRLFVKMNEPKPDGRIPNKLKTFKKMDPEIHLNREDVIDEFIVLHQQFAELIRKSERLNLDKTKVATAIPIVKLRLGDAFKFILAHTRRHVVHLERIKKAVLSTGTN